MVFTLFFTYRRGTIIITLHTAIQPPPNLPRRGGTDTIDCMTVVCSCLIIVCSYQIINRLSTAIVTVPPQRGRLGGD